MPTVKSSLRSGFNMPIGEAGLSRLNYSFLMLSGWNSCRVFGMSRSYLIVPRLEAETLLKRAAEIISTSFIDSGIAATPTDPLLNLDPQSGENIDEINRLAGEIIIARDDNSKLGRAILRGVILHVLTAKQFDGEGDLKTVGKLILCGEWRMAEAMRADKKTPECPYLLLWRSMESNPACDGIVAVLGAQFRHIAKFTPNAFQDAMRNLQMRIISHNYGAAFKE